MSSPIGPIRFHQTTRVYRNLHKKCYSIQQRALVSGKARINLGGWRVVGHADSVYLTAVSFVVSEAGRRRVLREKKKNVHAKVEGVFQGIPFFEDELAHFFGHTPVTYNPYKAPFFFDKTTGREVVTAQRVWLTPHGCWAAGVGYGNRVADGFHR